MNEKIKHEKNVLKELLEGKYNMKIISIFRILRRLFRVLQFVASITENINN